MANNNTYDVEDQDVEYQRLAGKPWLARIYRPKGAGPFPTIVDVHGGAWHNGDRLNNAGVDRALAAKGMVVAAIDFRQPPEAGYPASICDVNLAVRWLKAHAAEFNGTATVGAFGNSSGGHQVVLSALRPRHAAYSTLPLPDHSDVDAGIAYVVAAWPVICPLYRFNYAKRIDNQQHIQAHIDYWRTEEAMAEGSPQTIVEQEAQIDLVLTQERRQEPSAGNAGALHRLLPQTRRSDRSAYARRPAGAPHGAVAGPAGNDALHRHRQRIHTAANQIGIAGPLDSSSLRLVALARRRARQQSVDLGTGLARERCLFIFGRFFDCTST
jgi:hypothetical protein